MMKAGEAEKEAETEAEKEAKKEAEEKMKALNAMTHEDQMKAVDAMTLSEVGIVVLMLKQSIEENAALKDEIRFFKAICEMVERFLEEGLTGRKRKAETEAVKEAKKEAEET